MNSNKTGIGIIGCGNMGSALAASIAAGADIELHLYDIDTDRLQKIASQTGATAATDPSALLSSCRAVILALKPDQMHQLSGSYPETLLVSIAAGLSLEKLGTLFPESKIIRVMPNTPAMIGRGVAAYCGNGSVGSGDLELAAALFNGSCTLFQVPEKLMDAVTGLSGSGPAYVFAAINALAEGGVLNGLPKETALKMAATTFAGAAMMILEQQIHPEILKDRVTSPGGTTAAGLAVLERGGMRSLFIDAVTAAANRSRELGNG